MKASKFTLIAQAIGMYLMHIPLYIFFIVELIPPTNEDFVAGLVKAALILMIPVAVLCVANIILSVVSLFKGDTDISKTVMKVKLALIPWYALNFAMCGVIVLLMLNPFTMIGVPVAVFFLLAGTYFCMIATSLPNVAYYIRKVFIKREETLASNRVVPIVMHFFFCLDVVGSILIYRQNKTAARKPVADSAPSESE